MTRDGVGRMNAESIGMALLATERLFWHCGAHTAEPKIGLIGPHSPIAYCRNLLFSVARGDLCARSATQSSTCTRWYQKSVFSSCPNCRYSGLEGRSEKRSIT